MPIGFTMPFARSTGSVGYFETTETELSAVLQNLRSLLVTNWGQRVMHYNFGCNFVEFLFEQRGPELRERMTARVTSQVEKWMPFVSLDDVDVIFPDEDPTVPENGVRVRMRFRLSTRPDRSALFDHIVNP